MAGYTIVFFALVFLAVCAAGAVSEWNLARKARKHEDRMIGKVVRRRLKPYTMKPFSTSNVVSIDQHSRKVDAA